MSATAFLNRFAARRRGDTGMPDSVWTDLGWTCWARLKRHLVIMSKYSLGKGDGDLFTRQVFLTFIQYRKLTATRTSVLLFERHI